MSGNDKCPLMPRLRFPDFQNAEAWQVTEVEKLISTITPPKKIPASDYLPRGEYPIIDQGQSAIAGWTNDPDALVAVNEPLIVFGDHTCSLKFVRRTFAQGADGIKIIRAKEPVSIGFLYQSLCFKPVTTEEYKRHFSTLKAILIAYPKRQTGEQQKIAECLFSIDDLIAAESHKLTTLQAYMNGLLQKLFPRGAENLPQLRFFDFRPKTEWAKFKLGDAVSPIAREKQKPTLPYTGLGIRSHGKGTFLKPLENPEKNSMEVLYEVRRDDLIVNITFAWEGALAIAKSIDDGALVSHRFPTYTVNREIAIPEFIRHIILSREFIYNLGIISPGGAGRNRVLNKGDFLELPIRLPSIDEQRHIAGCLSPVNDLIAAQISKVESLKNHKKGLMEQLFPEIDDEEQG